MRKATLACAGIATIVLATVAASGVQQSPRATYANPILDVQFPDPSVTRVGGTMYAYGTGNLDDKASTMFVPMSTSTDLRNWSKPKLVLEKPVWASGGIWAPHVVQDPRRPGRFVMFFSARAIPGVPGVPPNSRYCLAVAEASSPAGPFKPTGQPLDADACRLGDGDIDPYVLFDEADPAGKPAWLYWGSAHKPLRRQQIAPDMLSLVPGTKRDILAPTVKPPGGRDRFTDLVEGAWMLRRGGQYYMFTSGFFCCSRNDDAYAVVVWRSATPIGPWTRNPNGVDGTIVRANARWASPGHNGIFTDGAGQDWIIYHARRPGKAGKRVLLIDRLEWRDGWPHIVTDAEADTPSVGPMPAPKPL